MKKHLVKTTDKNLRYDEVTGAFLNTSDDELKIYQAARARALKESRTDRRILELERRIEVLEKLLKEKAIDV